MAMHRPRRVRSVNTPARKRVGGPGAFTGVVAVRLPEGRGNSTLGRVIPPSLERLFAMANGKVDFFNDTGGYGFISTDSDDVDDDEDVFFHMEDVGGPDLEEGQEVEFDIESSPKGPRATNLVRN
jgi:CspA family cold shock protein